MRNKTIVLLCCLFSFVLITIASVSLIPYYQSFLLCRTIRDGNTDVAIKRIETTKNTNCYSAPLSLRWLYNSFEVDIELPLIVACEEGNYEVVCTLLENGADPNKYLERGWSAFEATFKEQNDSRLLIAKKLLEYNANINSYGSTEPAIFHELQNYVYKTEITNDELNYHRECILFFIDNGAVTKDNRGNTVLHYTSMANDLNLTKLMVEKYKIYIDSTGDNGQTPLMWAIKRKSKDTISYLLELGANVNIKDDNGKTAMDYALDINDDSIVSLLTKTSNNTRDGSMS